MHRFLRAIGFSKQYSKQEIDQLLGYVMNEPDYHTIIKSGKTNNKLNNSDAFPEGSQVRSYFATLLHDPSLLLLSSHIETNYADYYLYSTKLNKLGFPASSFGQNLHIAVTKNGHIYLASPQIDYDF